jgi:hypothetical protein
MGMMDLQNLVGRSFETQAIYQQAVSQADQALRQAERRLDEERRRRQAQVEEGSESAAGAALDFDADKKRDHARREPYRSYRLGRGGQAAAAELETPGPPPPGGHIDLTA